MPSSTNDNNIVFNVSAQVGGLYLGWGGLDGAGDAAGPRLYNRDAAGAPVHAAPDGSWVLGDDGAWVRDAGAWVQAISVGGSTLVSSATAVVTAQALVIADPLVQAGDIVTAQLQSDDTGGALGPIVTGVCGAATVTLNFTNATTNNDGVVQYQVTRP